MKIQDLFRLGRPLFSFEFFPPQTREGEELLFQTLEELRALRPDFVSVTYGAGGSTRGRTVEWVVRIKHQVGLEPMAHLTCIGDTREGIRRILLELQTQGIENVLALRGDPPRDGGPFLPPQDGFTYAYQLVRFIREVGDFCIGGAGYPEGHPESPSLEKDLEYLKIKVDTGLDFVITQLFFDNALYFRYVERARRIGVQVPILAGIMPITNVAQIKRFTALCRATIPPALMAQLDRYREDPEAVERLGIEYATRQCQELLDQGVPGIHFYTLNRSRATREIFQNLQASHRLETSREPGR